MVILPRLRCPACGKAMGPVKAKEVPPANKFEDCLRQCPRCRIGASNAKNPAKVKYIYADTTPAENPAADAPPAETPKADTAPAENPKADTTPAENPPPARP